MSALLLISAASVKSQVTMGSLNEPHKAAVLDLDATTKGLLLPNVFLTDVSVFAPLQTDISSDGKGMLVYNTNPDVIGGTGKGLYVWDGSKWNPLQQSAESFGDDPCLAPFNLTYTVNGVSGTTGSSFEGGADITLTVTGDNISGYKWYKSPDDVSVLSSSESLVISPSSTSVSGTYYCVAVNDCGGSTEETVSNNFTVTVSAAPVDPGTTATLSGITCYDVKQSPANDNANSCGAWSGRTAAFPDEPSRTQTYNMNISGSLTNRTNLEVTVTSNPSSMIKLVNGSPASGAITIVAGAIATASNNFTITFADDINTLASGRYTTGAGAYAPLKAVIWVTYNDNGTITGKEMTISVKDCVCCGAFIAPGVWKVFMCHNLGADESADPFTPDQALHGAMYKWGVKDPALTAAENIANSGTVSGWTSITPPPETGADWDMVNANPCPAGYRVPTLAEWNGVASTYNNTWTRKGTFSNSATNWTAGRQVGDGLFLPAAGQRDGNYGGALSYRGYQGCCLSSTADGIINGMSLFFDSSSQYGRSDPLSTGNSVRCIEDN